MSAVRVFADRPRASGEVEVNGLVSAANLTAMTTRVAGAPPSPPTREHVICSRHGVVAEVTLRVVSDVSRMIACRSCVSDPGGVVRVRDSATRLAEKADRERVASAAALRSR